MGNLVTVAGVQMAPRVFDKEYNLAYCQDRLREAHRRGAQLVVFPECALTGYLLSPQEALSIAEEVPGPSTNAFATTCAELDVYAVIGMLERVGNRFYNAAVLVGPEGVIGKYRKLHLPYLGVDRYASHGDLPLQPFETPLGRIGMGICYDGVFPEHARVLAILGADIIALPTNWPTGSRVAGPLLACARAVENHVYVLAVNRVGTERSTSFLGRSRFAGLAGEILADGSSEEEQLLLAQIDVTAARQKHQVILPGEWEVDFIHDRRPEMYAPLVRPQKDATPRR